MTKMMEEEERDGGGREGRLGMRGGVVGVLFVSLWLRLSRVAEWVFVRKIGLLISHGFLGPARCTVQPNIMHLHGCDAQQELQYVRRVGIVGIALYCFAARTSTLCSGLEEIKHR